MIDCMNDIPHSFSKTTEGLTLVIPIRDAAVLKKKVASRMENINTLTLSTPPPIIDMNRSGLPERKSLHSHNL